MHEPVSHSSLPVSPWVARFAPLVPSGTRALDVACGSGRHARHLAARGVHVDAVDRDPAALAALAGVAGVTPLCADLERGDPWPYDGRQFDAIIVTNYLFRPLLPRLAASLAPGGVLIYETFMIGNERFGKPSNADFLLRPHELLDWVRAWPGDATVLAFEQGEVSEPKLAMVQRICARRGGAAA